MARTALYRHFDSEGSLLYIGIALCPTYRLSKHRSRSPWFERIASITVHWYASRHEAMNAERQAIQAEHPLENIAHSRLPVGDDLPDIMPWGPQGRPLYKGQKPCPPEVQKIFISKGWWKAPTPSPSAETAPASPPTE